MHREIDRSGQQRLLDLPGEQALAAGLAQRPIADQVAGGADHLERDPVGGPSQHCGQALAHLSRLGERQRAAARSDAQARDVRRGLHLMTSQCYAGPEP